MISLKASELTHSDIEKMREDFIVLFTNGTVLTFQFLDWDTNFFGKSSFKLSDAVLKDNTCKNEIELFKRASDETFIVIMADSNIYPDAGLFWESLGFSFIQTALRLKFNTKKALQQLAGSDRDSSIRFLKVNSLDDYDPAPLGRVFKLSRFHADARISNSKADELWENYITNFKPDENKHAFIAEKNGQLAGAILVNCSHDGNIRVCDLFFVSVLEEFASSGIGSGLMHFTLQWALDNSDTIVVDTQASNLRAVNFYIKNGFIKIDKSFRIYHKWC